AAQAAGELLRRVVSGSCEGEGATTLVPEDLRHQVRGGAEAVEADALGVAGEPQRAVADESGAEERRALDVRQPGWQRQDEAGVGGGVLGVAPVARVAGEAGEGAQVLRAPEAEATAAARPGEPRKAHPIARLQLRDAGPDVLDRGDDLMAQHARQRRIG